MRPFYAWPRCPTVAINNMRRKELRKHAYFKCIENFTNKNWKFSDKKSDIFQISAQNINCSWAEIRKMMYTPVNLSFTI